MSGAREGWGEMGEGRQVMLGSRHTRIERDREREKQATRKEKERERWNIDARFTHPTSRTHTRPSHETHTHTI